MCSLETGLFDIWAELSLRKYLPEHNLFINYVYFPGKQCLQIYLITYLFERHNYKVYGGTKLFAFYFLYFLMFTNVF